MTLTVFFKDGTIRQFTTIKDCAKALYCDRRTLYAYLHGEVRLSCVETMVVKILRED